MKKDSLVLPVIAALVAAIVGGAVWATIAVVTEYQIGIVAWVLGGLAAYAVSYTSYRITTAHQVIAVVASLLGILLGKYFWFAYLLSDSLKGITDGVVFALFRDNISEMFKAIDIIFVVLAVVTAWQLPAKLGGKLSKQEATAYPAE